LKAKIDTGADNSSVGEELARELGFGEALDYFASYEMSTEMSQEEAKEKAKEINSRVRRDQPDIAGLSIVSSSHGVTLRMRIRMKVKLAGYTMDIEPTVVNRGHLTYRMLIGRRNLAHFLVDTTKVPLMKKEVVKKEASSDKA